MILNAFTFNIILIIKFKKIQIKIKIVGTYTCAYLFTQGLKYFFAPKFCSYLTSNTSVNLFNFRPH